MKKINYAVLVLVMCLSLSLSGCGYVTSTNKSTTQTFYDLDGNVTSVIEEKEMSDDAVYYEQAANVIKIRNTNTCAPNCAPGELGMIKMTELVGNLLGKNFVERGKNGAEVFESVANNFVDKGPLGLAIWQLGKGASRPNKVNMNGDGATYAPNEFHWTGNSGDDSIYRGPYNYYGTEE